MNYTINVNLKLELPECFDRESAEIVKDHLAAQVNQIMQMYNVDNKTVDASVINLCHIDDNWDAPEGEYDWR